MLRAESVAVGWITRGGAERAQKSPEEPGASCRRGEPSLNGGEAHIQSP